MGSSTEPASKNTNSSFDTNPAHLSPRIEDSQKLDRIAGSTSGQSNDLWGRAYEALKARDSSLVAEYEIYLTSASGSQTAHASKSPSPEVIEAVVKQKLQDHDAKQWMLNCLGKSIKVKVQGEKIIKFILWSNDIISTALSSQPYAALAWSGVSILLPVSFPIIDHYTQLFMKSAAIPQLFEAE